MKPGAPRRDPHLSAAAAGARWRRRAVLIVGAIGGLVLAANVALLAPLLHRDALQTAAAGGAAAAAGRGFLESFDADGDGILDGREFERIVAEACSLDLARLPFWQRLRRLLNPRFILHSPCARAQLLTAFSSGGGGGGGGARRSDLSVLSPASGSDGPGGGAREGGGGGGAGSGGGGGGGEAKGGAEAGGAAAAAAAEAATSDSGGQTAAEKEADAEAARRKATAEGCPPLSKELLGTIASRGTVLLVAADWAAWDVFGVNWLAHVQRAGITNYLVAALDEKTRDFLVSNKLGHCTLGADPLPAAAEPFQHGSEAHKAASWARLDTAAAVAAAGFDAVVSDIDALWFRDPTLYVAERAPPAADLVVASDQIASANAAGDHGLESNPRPDHNLHTSVLFVRASPGGRAALLGLQQHRRAAQQPQQQGDPQQQQGQQGELRHPSDALKAWLRSGAADAPAPSAAAAAESRLLRVRLAGGGGGGLGAWLGLGGEHELPDAQLPDQQEEGGRAEEEQQPDSVAVGVFSPAVVQHGYMAFVSKQHKALGLPPEVAPIAVHFGLSGRSKESRLHRMREAMWYADGPTYYTDPLLLSFDLPPLDTPDNFTNWNDTEPMLRVHVDSLEAQLAEFYAAAAIATALGRTLILPPFACHCWNPVGRGHAELCRAPGDGGAALPFTCTLEQLFRPRALYAHLPVFDNRRLTFREHSFLDNRRTPSWVKHARTEVGAGQPRCGTPAPSLCVEVNSTKPPRMVNQQIILPTGLDDTQITELLKPYEKAKLLHLPQPSQLFGGFRDLTRRSQFEIWMDSVLVPWCCRTPEAALKAQAQRFAKVRARSFLAKPPAAAGAAAGAAASGAAASGAAASGAAGAGAGGAAAPRRLRRRALGLGA
ncbi:hypothetical protein Rsub_08709 [Raphidocelis subcapitata]|uniref:EF-hand domain-containing protein n=1 Tax=Raphidocelis subcapitata TaxID=307507 RepID=A0A2V0PEW6_9CHLO|nr:hypothetical protein Rsub_08709 [Raphidocelis subcapitata]|eukprot:GBF95727.1 hypothetical protein Rsub_08709 [Raphidocelis subcapitata]